MAIGAAAGGRREAACHHGKRPARGDGRPSSAFRFGMPERNIRHNTITQQNEDESPHEFAEELRAHSCLRCQATASSQLCLLHKDCFCCMAELDPCSTLAVHLLVASGESSGLICY